MSDKINNGELETGSAIKSEAPLHKLSAEQLDAVSGGNENSKQAEWVRETQALLRQL